VEHGGQIPAGNQDRAQIQAALATVRSGAVDERDDRAHARARLVADDHGMRAMEPVRLAHLVPRLIRPERRGREEKLRAFGQRLFELRLDLADDARAAHLDVGDVARFLLERYEMNGLL